MHLNKTAIENLDRIKRINIINSISGIKPANLIGTIARNNQTNLAIFSSVVHLGSDPALLGFIMRPENKVGRHTYENIMDNGFYTINHVNKHIAERAHFTSAKFEKNISEFNACNLTEEYLFEFKAPFVKESKLKIAMTFKESIPIHANNTILVIGEINHIVIPNNALHKEGYIDLGVSDNVGIAGLNTYYELNSIAQYPYARVHEIPDFHSNKI